MIKSFVELNKIYIIEKENIIEKKRYLYESTRKQYKQMQPKFRTKIFCNNKLYSLNNFNIS